MSDKMLRYNEGKPDYTLIHYPSLRGLVDALTYGATKYERDNWKKSAPSKELCASLMRHLIAYMEGEEFDEESGASHMGHIMANAMFIEYANNKNREK